MQLISVRSLAARLSLGFGVILVLLLGMAVLSLLRMQALSATLEEITVHNAAFADAQCDGAQCLGLRAGAGRRASTDLEGGPAVLARVRTTLTQYDGAQTRLKPCLPATRRRWPCWGRSKPPAALRASYWLWARN
ncbi:MAG: hypothetical protein IPJ36_14935 [Simplicispira sp.]|nr:hypothetical protein [Simplicispira sp.]